MMYPCPVCNQLLGNGKGLGGLARHGCDVDAKYAARFFKAGASFDLCAKALRMSSEKVQILVRLAWGRRR